MAAPLAAMAQSSGPESLRGVTVPEPTRLADYVVSKPAAIALGKALFWEMRVGSDGRTACATCHFQAGADSRSKNQLQPGLARVDASLQPNPDTTFQLGGPNYQLKLDDFPFHAFANPNDRQSAVVRSHNDAATSQGVFKERYDGSSPGAAEDQRSVLPDAVFRVGSANVRQVEPRNSPTVINAVFNFRNFWDGRAQWQFNGVNPFGARDPNARVYKNVLTTAGYQVQPVQVLIDNASLASQASGPPLSDLEMSAAGRTLPALARRLHPLRPLALQRVDATDSVLASYRDASGLGLGGAMASYEQAIRLAFQPAWWNGTQAVAIGGVNYTQMEANFGLFFGLALQLYQATLVSDQTPFDRYVDGSSSAMSQRQAIGMGLFFGKGKCVNCHGGAEFTNASVRKIRNEPLSRMTMGDNGIAVYDEGFYNIGITRTLEDIGVGGLDPFGRPLSFSEISRGGGDAFRALVGISPNVTAGPTERVAVRGGFKTPGLRNVELTAPYFHNGGAATLRQVVEFYNRGGNFADANRPDLDADIQPLGLTNDEITSMVEFLKGLTDDRVKFHAAPFDHPQLLVADGHQGDTASVPADGSGRALDRTIEIPAVGRAGYGASLTTRLKTPVNFLETALSGVQAVRMVARHSGQCLAIQGTNPYDEAKAQQTPCAAAVAATPLQQRFLLVPEASGRTRIYPQNGDQSLEVWAGSGSAGIPIQQDATEDDENEQRWTLVHLGDGWYHLVNEDSRLCVAIENGSLASGAASVQYSCSVTDPITQFRLESLGELRYEVEAARSRTATTATSRSGSTYKGYANFRSSSHRAIFDVMRPSRTGEFGLKLRYAASAASQVTVSVNGGAATTISLPAAASWTTYTLPQPLALSAGMNTLQLQGVSGNVDIDSLDLVLR